MIDDDDDDGDKKEEDEEDTNYDDNTRTRTIIIMIPIIKCILLQSHGFRPSSSSQKVYTNFCSPLMLARDNKRKGPGFLLII